MKRILIAAGILVWSKWTPLEAVVDSAQLNKLMAAAKAKYRKFQYTYAYILQLEAHDIEEHAGDNELKKAAAREARLKAHLFWESMIAANPKVAICAYDAQGGEWLRIKATLIEDPRVEVKKAMLDANPSLRSMYDENDDNTAVYFLKDAKATISAFTHDPVEIDF